MSDRGEFKANADHQDRVLPNPDKIRFEEDCNDSVDLHSQYESHQYEARQTMAYFESKSVFIFQLIKSSLSHDDSAVTIESIDCVQLAERLSLTDRNRPPVAHKWLLSQEWNFFYATIS